MKPVKITSRNIMFTEPMGQSYDLNIGLIIGDQYNYVIDTGLGSGSVEPLFDYLCDDAKPIIVVNTHCHWDHIWGNWVFKDSIIIAHAYCRARIDRYWNEAILEYSGSMDGEVRKCLPNVVIEDFLYFPDDGVRIFYTPGHSIDCISIFDEVDKVLYAGDNIGDTAEVIVPFISTSPEIFKDTIGKYRRIDFETCISGHNKPQGTDITDLMESSLEDCWRKQVEEYGIPD